MKHSYSGYYILANIRTYLSYVWLAFMLSFVYALLYLYGIYPIMVAITVLIPLLIILNTKVGRSYDAIFVSKFGHSVYSRHMHYTAEMKTDKRIACTVRYVADIKKLLKDFAVFDTHVHKNVLFLILDELLSISELEHPSWSKKEIYCYLSDFEKHDHITLYLKKHTVYIKCVGKKRDYLLVNTLSNKASRSEYKDAFRKHRLYYVSVQRNDALAVKRTVQIVFGKIGYAIRTLFLHLFRILTLGFVLLCLYVGYRIHETDLVNQIQEDYYDALDIVSTSTYDDFTVSGGSVTFYDKDGNTLYTINANQKSSLTADALTETMKNVAVSAEDANFYEHSGIDPKAILRATIAYLKNGYVTQGGSTITQQLMKNVYLTQEQTIDRKIKEIVIAYYLDGIYSKDQILTAYLNNCYYANGITGLNSAAWYYFGVSTTELDTAQMAYLMAIPNSPTKYDPLANPDNTKDRQEYILKRMYILGYLTEEEYDAAVVEEITLADQAESDSTSVYGLRTYLIDNAVEDIMEESGFVFKAGFSSDEEKDAYESAYNESYTSCYNILMDGDMEVYTTIDTKMQQALIDASNNALSGFTELQSDGQYMMQASATVIDASNGSVIAVLPGRQSEDGSFSSLNRATSSYRQPGSSIKPVIVYTPSFDLLGVTPSSTIVDQAIANGPSNDNGSYSGSVSILTAVTKSINTVAWQLYEQVTPKTGYKYLSNMLFSGLEPEDANNTAMALGGFTEGVTTMEMAGAYSAIATDGNWTKPTCIAKIVRHGETYYEEAYEETQIYSSDATAMMRECLESVVSSGTGISAQIDGTVVGGKTGTTNDNKDGWFCGYAMQGENTYVMSVWVGCDTPTSVSDLYGSSYPSAIFKNALSAYFYN